MVKLISVTAQDGYNLQLEYDDGVVGSADLSSFVGKGVFTVWKDAAVFDAVTVGPHGQLRWTKELELCADAMYLQITGKSAEDLFPSLRVPTDA
ncbi:MAG: DUF2442 domain-containing protein [Pirellulaceae bacterium]|nr:DUF2442 domain-containing protein [Fuerstiella sp.]HIK92168.1 DUF2442 domain-containing protein [Planctomycetota bacterium]